ncbi:MAG: transposase [Thiobacillus sp.]|nr:transposase [Thiobacillus sp.]
MHIVQRGRNREPSIFGEKDDQSCLHWRGEALKKERCALHAYALITNHVQLPVSPERAESLPRLIIALGRREQHRLPPYRQRVGQPLQILADPGGDQPVHPASAILNSTRARRHGRCPRPLPLGQLSP